MTELITGAKGSAHVTSAQQGAINAYTIGTGAYILNGCAASMPAANTLHIAAGHLMVQGRAIEVTATDLTIANGTQGTKRHDLACVHYVISDGVETTALSVVKGTESANPADPTVSGSILAGDATADIPLWRVSLDGITPTVKAIALSAIHNEIVLYNGGNALTYDTPPAIPALSCAITLSETAANFHALKLFYVTDDGWWGSVEVPFPNGKKVTMATNSYNGVAMHVKSKTVIISGTTITAFGTNGSYSTGTWVSTGALSTGDYIGIVRVEGIR